MLNFLTGTYGQILKIALYVKERKKQYLHSSSGKHIVGAYKIYIQ